MQGQASSSGTDTLNDPRARAEAVKKGLVEAGVAESEVKLTSTGAPKAQPAR